MLISYFRANFNKSFFIAIALVISRGISILEYEHIYKREKTLFDKTIDINYFKKKTCTFDCLYCPNLRENIYTQRVFSFPVSKVLNELADYISTDDEPSFIEFRSKGETTLYMLHGTLTKKIKELYPNIKQLIYTNNSLLYRQDVFNELLVSDIIISRVDALIDEEFQNMNKPHESIKLTKILFALEKFSQKYQGELIIRTNFIENINDSEENIQALKEFLKKINPAKHIVVFPEVEKFPKISSEKKERIKAILKDVPFPVDFEQ